MGPAERPSSRLYFGRCIGWSWLKYETRDRSNGVKATNGHGGPSWYWKVRTRSLVPQVSPGIGLVMEVVMMLRAVICLFSP